MMSKRGWNGIKKKATSEDKYFNCHKIGHFGRNCTAPDIRLLKKKRNRGHIVAVADDDSNTKPKSFKPGKAYMAKEKFNLQASKGIWYLDSYASHHLTNNKDLFIDEFCPKYLDFTNAGKQTLHVESIGTIAIPLANGLTVKLEKVTYIPKYDSNLISLG